MHPFRVVAMVLVSAGLLAMACSSATSDGSTFKGGGGAGGMLNLSGSGGNGGSLDVDADITDSGSPCAQVTQFIYVVSSDNMLFKFDPPSLSFSPIGKLQCPNPGLAATPFSMSVDRKGTAWVVFTSGKLFWVDVKTAACSATSYVPNQKGFSTFGMGFASDAPGSAEETLYVTDGTTGAPLGLAKIDTKTLELIPIGKYDLLPNKRAEMTGTGNAGLFGAFEGQPYIVSEIDKQTAAILSQAPQSAIAYAPGSSNFAFAHWGGDFWLFVGPGTKTDVFQFKPADNTTALVKTVQDVIVGAGVSTCAPVSPVK